MEISESTTSNGVLTNNASSSSLSPNAKEFIPSPNEDPCLKNRSSTSKSTGAVRKRLEPKSNNDGKKYFSNNSSYKSNGYRQLQNVNGFRGSTHHAAFERDQDDKHQNGTPRKFYQDNQKLYQNDYRDNPHQNSRPISSTHSNNRRNNHQRRFDPPPRFVRDGVAQHKVEMPQPSIANARINNNSQKQQNKVKREKPQESSKINQRERLIKDIESNKLECLICCDIIKDHHTTWSCSNCYNVLHLNCIKTWITNSKTDSGDWRCVACQTLRQKVPREYCCFCGRIKNPQLNRNDLPHSCGEMCGSTDLCSHPCTLLCHPGPHIVCQSFVQRSCGCGKSSKLYQCSMKETFECDEICSKLLDCGVHHCSSSCHQGACTACDKQVEMKCFCQKELKSVKCSLEIAKNPEYSCGKICDRELDCKNHRCKKICHLGDCGICDLSPNVVTSCPCGKTPVAPDQRSSCLDPVPLCKSQCRKQLKCGPLSDPHFCISKCHEGNCPPCNKSSNIRCRCGRIEEKIQCKTLSIKKDVRCKKKCLKFKSCGRHKCSLECCIDPDHICQANCNKLLNCKKHKCEKKCHIGLCRPCPRVSFDELRCECGTEVIYPPVACGVPVPVCTKPCARRHPCDHPVTHHCHSEQNCPPCVFLTTKWCYGAHEQRKTIPCNQESFSCGLPCAKALRCGRHLCIKTCHQKECEKPGEVCQQRCSKKRLDCGHFCSSSCHDGDCPDTVCKEKVEVQCSCGNLKMLQSCELVSNENRKIQRAQQLMQLQQMDDDAVVLQRIDSSLKRTTKILDCNDECKTLERNRRLDIAFKVENPNLISYPKFIPDYSDFVKTFYKKDSTFVNGIHEKLSELVKLSKESKQKFRSHSFPIMNRDKRHVVHDLAELFGIETQAYDAEPNRNIVATASRESVRRNKFIAILSKLDFNIFLFLVLAAKYEHPGSYAA